MQWPEKHDFGFQMASPSENQFDGTWHSMIAMYPNFLKEQFPYIDWQDDTPKADLSASEI